MRGLSKADKRVLRKIASFYGCHKVRFSSSTSGGGFYAEDCSITIGTDASTDYVFTTFFHELAHVLNHYTGKYEVYHAPISISATISYFPTEDAFIEYAISAEIYTDKVGKRLCATWAPGIKYKRIYRRNNEIRDYFRSTFF